MDGNLIPLEKKETQMPQQSLRQLWGNSTMADELLYCLNLDLGSLKDHFIAFALNKMKEDKMYQFYFTFKLHFK